MSNHTNDDAFVIHGNADAVKQLEQQLADFRCPGCNTPATMLTDPDGIVYADIVCQPDCPENTDKEN